ncbi:MAG: hypothetical protein U0133_06510 [Gemmatimonadales bacterium]
MKPHDVRTGSAPSSAPERSGSAAISAPRGRRLADLIVLDGNPLEDIHNTNTIRYVMKNRSGSTTATPSTRCTRRGAPLPKQWWWDANTGDVGAVRPMTELVPQP